MGQSRATHSLAPSLAAEDGHLPPQPVRISELDHIATIDAGLSVYDYYSEEHLYSLSPAVDNDLNKFEPAWRPDGDGNDDD
jgi:hypothetical protein